MLGPLQVYYLDGDKVKSALGYEKGPGIQQWDVEVTNKVLIKEDNGRFTFTIPRDETEGTKPHIAWSCGLKTDAEVYYIGGHFIAKKIKNLLYSKGTFFLRVLNHWVDF